MNDFDDRIRDGLAGDGTDLPPAPPFADVERRARRLARRRRAVAGGALLGTVAVVVGIVAMQQPDDEDGHTVVVTQPDTSTTSTNTEVATTTTTDPTPDTTTTTITTTTPVPELPAGVPGEIVTYDPSTRQLVVAQTATGEVVEVLDTIASDAELRSVDVASDGTIWYATFDPESQQGTVHRVIRGQEPVDGPAGLWVEPGPDGLIAVLDSPVLRIYAAGAAEGVVVDDGSLTQQGSEVTWSPDGRWLVVTSTRDGLIVFDTTVEGFPAQTFRAPGNGHYRGLEFTADGRFIAVHFPACDPLGGGTAPPCDTVVPEVLMLDPASGAVLDTVDVATDESIVDLASTGASMLVTSIFDWEPFSTHLIWYADRASGTVPGPYTSYAVWAPPATGG